MGNKKTYLKKKEARINPDFAIECTHKYPMHFR
jgi:hypothetical protein